MNQPWSTLVGVVGALLLIWLVFVITIWRVRPDDLSLKTALRLLPDLLRLLKRVASDPTVPRPARLQLWLLLAYLAMPIDLIPDFLPVIGYADDAVITILALRSVVRHAGLEPLTRHWPGTPAGLAALLTLTGLSARSGEAPTDQEHPGQSPSEADHPHRDTASAASAGSAASAPVCPPNCSHAQHESP